MRSLISLWCLFMFIANIQAQDDPILFSVNDNQVKVSEFNYIYQKNNGENADYSKESLDDYLDLYLKFKLKVERAKEMGLDTVVALQKELAGYRKQLANSYLVDKEVAHKLIEEVGVRMKEDREVSHIFIAAEPKSSPEREAQAKEKASTIQRKLGVGDSFEELARTLSDDKASAINGGKLGYYTAPLPNGFYEFENALYETEIGGVSRTVRSKMGFHILKIASARPARGEMEVSHILIRKKMLGKLVTNAEEKINDIYKQLEDGAEFDELAVSLSEDKNTKAKKGYLGFFGVNQFEKSFEDAAFALSKDNSYTNPIETKIGWHIIKRISKRDYSDKNDMAKRIKAKIANSDRYEIARKSMITQIKKESGYQQDQAVIDDFVSKLNEEFFTYKWQAPSLTEKQICSFGDQNYTNIAFADFAKKQTRDRLKYNNRTPLKTVVGELFEKYVEEKALEYEEANLENKYEDFRSLMREYEEGILLFEATKLEVWDKASDDDEGLKSFFAQNESKYKWGKRAKLNTYTIQTDDNKLAKKIFKSSQKMTKEEVMAEYVDYANILTIEQNVLEEGNSALSDIKMKRGASSAMIYDDVTKTTSFRTIEEIKEEMPKTLDEARGYVIADYQDFLEKEWIDSLRSKYNINIDDKIFNALVKK